MTRWILKRLERRKFVFWSIITKNDAWYDKSIKYNISWNRDPPKIWKRFGCFFSNSSKTCIIDVHKIDDKVYYASTYYFITVTTLVPRGISLAPISEYSARLRTAFSRLIYYFFFFFKFSKAPISSLQAIVKRNEHNTLALCTTHRGTYYSYTAVWVFDWRLVERAHRDTHIRRIRW